MISFPSAHPLYFLLHPLLTLNPLSFPPILPHFSLSPPTSHQRGNERQERTEQQNATWKANRIANRADQRQEIESSIAMHASHHSVHRSFLFCTRMFLLNPE
jgi:hypothetical protein